MENVAVGAKVEKFIIEQFIFEDDQKIGPDDSLLETGTIDSTGILELVLFLEETFTIKIEDEDLVPDNLDSVNKIAAFVDRQIAAR